MSRIIDSLDAVSGRYRAVLCDLWGCYHDGLRPHAPAVAALQRYRAAGGIVILLTNAPRPAPSVKAFLDGMDAPEDSYDGIMSSGEACQRAIASGAYGTAIHYVGPARDLHMLTDTGRVSVPLEKADAILCTGLASDDTETPADYADRITAWVTRGIPMLCANPDIVVDRGHERLFCAGALAEAFSRAGGEVIWFGKPHLQTYEQSFALLEELAGGPVPPEQVLAIGDGIHTDVRGGLAHGLDVVFVSGGLAAAEVGDSPDTPDPVRLEAWLAGQGEAPTWTIGRLR